MQAHEDIGQQVVSLANRREIRSAQLRITDASAPRFNDLDRAFGVRARFRETASVALHARNLVKRCRLATARFDRACCIQRFAEGVEGLISVPQLVEYQSDADV